MKPLRDTPLIRAARKVLRRYPDTCERTRTMILLRYLNIYSRNIWGEKKKWVTPWYIMNHLPDTLKYHFATFTLKNNTVKAIYRSLRILERQNRLEEYNSFDGLIRWLRENQLTEFSISTLLRVVPKNIRKILFTWKSNTLNSRDVLHIYEQSKKLLQEEYEKYNYPDGFLVWCEEMGYYDMNVREVFTGISDEARSRMPHWRGYKGTLRDIRYIERQILSLGERELWRYNTREWMFEFMREHGYELWLNSFYEKLTDKVRTTLYNWKSIDTSYLYHEWERFYAEWKEIRHRTWIDFYSFTRYRKKHGTIQHIDAIFPLETFFDRTSELSSAQIYFGLRVISRNIRSVRRYQKNGTLSDRVLSWAISLDDTKNGLSRTLTEKHDMNDPEKGAHMCENNGHLEKYIWSVEDATIREILERIFCSWEDDISDADIGTVVKYVQRQPELKRILEERL